jgi:hypothetical protein
MGVANVAHGSKADIATGPGDVRLSPNDRHSRTHAICRSLESVGYLFDAWRHTVVLLKMNILIEAV